MSAFRLSLRASKKGGQMKFNSEFRNCLVCGTEFTVQPSKIERGRGKYCSRKCCAIGSAKTRQTGLEIPCAICGKLIYRGPSRLKEKNYCSRSCTAKGRFTKQKRNCIICGKEFYAIPANIKKGRDRCCSKICGDKSRWVTTTSQGYNLALNKNGVRDKNYRVIAEKALGRPLKSGETVHHIDMIKTNDTPTNLIICTNSYHHYLHHRMAERYAELFLRKVSNA